MPPEIIKEQHAENIFNIQGGLHLHNSPEVVEVLNRQKQDHLKLISSISFFDMLLKEQSKKLLIERNAIQEELKAILKESNQVMIHGDPGIGKTTIVFQLIRENDNVIYISAKDMSPISILSYLINKIRAGNNKELVDVAEINQAIELLRAELQYTTHDFVIDDCEQNAEVINDVISLEKMESRFIFLSRNKFIFEARDIKFYQVKPFDEPEVILFLKKNGIEPGTIDLNNIIRASHGNPLYLFYFSKQQVRPLPQSIVDYQSRIWNGLTPEQQEMLTYIAIPYYVITIAELAEVMGVSSIIDLSARIDNLSALLKNKEGELEVFHPSFHEFIIDILTSKGLIITYKERLGDYYLNKQEIIHATYLLLDINPGKVSDFLLDVFSRLANWGEFEFAAKVLNVKLSLVSSDFDKGYIHYHLCNLYHLLGKQEASTQSIDKALEYLKADDNREMYAAALMYKAMDLIRIGQIEDAILMADGVFLESQSAGIRPVLFVNLSKIYIDLYEFEKGATACKQAYALFLKENDTNGMVISLANLVACLTHIPDYLAEAESYGLQLFELVQRKSEFTLEIIVLNSLTSINRQKKNYVQAKEYGMRAIKLCQQYGLKEKVVLNLINYANIVRDEGDADEAVKIYNEALVYARQYNLRREEGRIYWIFAGIYQQKGELDVSIGYADKSIQVNTVINYFYGLANAWAEKADTLLLKDQRVNAAIALESCSDYFRKIEQFSKSSQTHLAKAVKIYLEEKQEQEANRLINKWIGETLIDFDYPGISDAILNFTDENTVTANFEKLFNKYFTEQGNHHNMIRQFLLYINFCKSISEGRREFGKMLTLIIGNIGKTRYASSMLGLGIEQSGSLLDGDDLPVLFSGMQKHLQFCSLRHVNEELIILVTIHEKINLEIHLFDDEPLCLKLAMALLLILQEDPNLVMNDRPEFLERHCTIWLHQYTGGYKKVLKDMIPNVSKVYNANTQSLHLSKTDYVIQEVIIISNEYEEYCDLNKYPDNKVSLYFLCKTIMGIKSHFYHDIVEKDGVQRRFILHAVANLFDYTDVEEKGTQGNGKGFDMDVSAIFSKDR